MRKFLLVAFLIFSQNLFAQTAPVTKSSDPFPGQLSIKTFQRPDKTWGYDVFKNEKLLIHQPGIPALAGFKGFSSKEKAKKTAGLVIKKIEQGEMPPTVTQEELKKLNVLN
jgi:hypothetical protein